MRTSRPKDEGRRVTYFSPTCFDPRQLDLFGLPRPKRKRRPSSLWRPAKEEHPGLNIPEEESND